MRSDTAEFLGRLQEHRGILASVANGYCRDRSSREDLLQEMIVQLLRSYPRYDEKRVSFSTWMYRIALNVAISFYRTQYRHTRHAADGDELTDVPDENREPVRPQRECRYEACGLVHVVGGERAEEHDDDRQGHHFEAQPHGEAPQCPACSAEIHLRQEGRV